MDPPGRCVRGSYHRRVRSTEPTWSSGRRYALVRMLAAGGMAQVYEARAELPGGIERRVALKRILPERARDPRYRAMFLDEARVVSRLDHPHVVRLLDYGLLDDAEFLVLELVDGLDAGEAFRLARAERIPVASAALRVVVCIAEALAHAHACTDERGAPLGIVHRDVSPSNVLLGHDGTVKLTDFGIALSTVKTDRTETGYVKGKAAFMSPEQGRGERVSAAADVWALGRTLLALSVGDPSASPEAWPAPIAPLLARCLAPVAGERPSAAEVAGMARTLAGPEGERELGALMTAVRPLHGAPTSFDRALDLLLEGGADGSRAFTVQNARTGPATPHARGAQSVLARRRALAAALALVGLAGMALLAMRWPETRAPEAPPAATAALDGGPASDAGTDAPATDAGEREGEPDAPREAPRAIRAHRPEGPAPRAPEPAPASTNETPVATGWLRIGGEALLRARVSIDGLAVGHAPLEREVAVGEHRVRVERDDGSVVLERSVAVTESHRRASPLRVTE